MATTPTYIFSRNERIYLQTQPTFGVIPNTTGSATVTGADACRFMHININNDVAKLVSPDKTGTRSMESMVGGRRFGHWDLEMATRGNGTPGVPPDCDAVLQSAFGSTATVTAGSTAAISSSTDATPIVVSASHGITAGTFAVVSIAGHTVNLNANGVWLAYANDSGTLTLVGSQGQGAGAGSGGTLNLGKVQYTLTDDIKFMTMYSFRNAGDPLNPPNIDQRIGNTCVVTEMTHTLNQDVGTWSARGDLFWTLRSRAFATSNQYEKGGLTSFPPEPTLPVTNGNIVPGFTGRFVAGLSAGATPEGKLAFAQTALNFPTVRASTIRTQFMNMMVRDTFGSYYPTLTEGDVRNITVSFEVYDDDSAEVNNMKYWADENMPVDFVINLGTEVGNTWVHVIRNVYLASSQIGDNQLRFTAGFGDSRATTTTLAVKDEYELNIA